MSFALIVWLVLILVIASTCPGFVTCLAVVFGLTALVVYYVVIRKDRKYKKEVVDVIEEYENS